MRHAIKYTKKDGLRKMIKQRPFVQVCPFAIFYCNCFVCYSDTLIFEI